MKIRDAQLNIVCGYTSPSPETDLPEIAFAGRSNVGKSSLINVLINRKGLARTSSQPGKTQTINFYNVNKELYFVDLPGYGFAKTSKAEQAKWGVMIDKYLRTSRQLKTVRFIPYYAWGNRGKGEMTVWFRSLLRESLPRNS